MARPDARIPLGVQQRDFAAPLTRLRDQEREDEVIASNQARQARMDESTLATQSLQRESLQQQIDARQNPPIDAGKKMELINSVAMDTIAFGDLLKKGDVKNSGALGISMLDRMTEAGVETDQFERVLALAAENPQDASTFMEDTILPILRTQISDGLSSPLRDANGKTTAFQNMKTGEITPFEEEEEVEFDNASYQAALRVRATGGTVGEGRFELTPESLQDINSLTPEGAEQQLTVGKFGRTDADTTLNDSRQGKLDEAQSFTQSLVSTLGDVKELIQANPAAQSFGGRVASFVANVKADAKGTAELLGVEFDESLFDINKYDEEFKGIGMAVTDARLKSAYTAAAYSLAAAQNAGRVSESDFRKALVQVGGNSSDSASALAVLDDVIARETRSFKDNYRNVTNTEFEGDFGIAAPDQVDESEFTEGQTATGPNGEKIIFTNGEWVSQ